LVGEVGCLPLRIGAQSLLEGVTELLLEEVSLLLTPRLELAEERLRIAKYVP
jgi:hypothetical protein